MNGSRSPLRRIAALAALAVAMVAIVGCARKVTTVNSSFTFPEGTRTDRVQQFAYPDIPFYAAEFLDRSPLGVGGEDTLLTLWRLYDEGAGILHGMIFDGTAASTYQILRRESGGGYAPMMDYNIDPVQRFQPAGWKLFSWMDHRPSSFSPPTYVGRGVVSGHITPWSPVTNAAVATADTIADLDAALDTTGTLRWASVPGATHYFVQIYKAIRSDPYSALYNSAPSPFATQDHKDALDAWIPCAADGTPLTPVVLQWIPMIPYQSYLMRMSAEDAEGRLLAYTYGYVNAMNLEEPGHYILYWTGCNTCMVGVSAYQQPQMRMVPASAMPRRAVAASVLPRGRADHGVTTTVRLLLSRP
ncbi:MAG TPA: hypothetical protein VMS88_01975 [Terriglobales bacterium]|nr:hypothetical protein [Terriglobales bacterium]